MFGRKIPLFKLLGFQVNIDLSWFILFFLIVWSLAAGLFPIWVADLAPSTYWLMGLAGALGLFVSIVLHEFMHSFVARRFGLPIKGITLFVFGGVAQMDEEPPSAKAEFFMAIAGPLTSIVLGAVFYLISLLGVQVPLPPAVSVIFVYLALINIILAIFNLLPAFPLDGGRVLRSVLWYFKGNIVWATRTAARIGAVFGGLLIAAGFFFMFAGNLIGGLWWILIGFFLYNAAKMSYQQLMMKSLLEGEKVRRFMKPEPVTVRPDMTIERLVNDYIYRYHYKMFPVVENGHLVSCISTQEIKELPREQWTQKTVADIAKSCSADSVVSPDDDVIKALNTMNKTDKSRLLVVNSQGDLQGVITLKDLMNFFSMKLDLEQKQ
ncbi:site-2 protease family protein [Chitinispirillales bacterium ANBcel5]|uniref:site-2 protease family protein n=1 Tax=Cellulosispirillum alkaliphilum TaxID=3039283 RepID=UPI002A584F06|nr:site-2 protease family protein [Chitinispirillales bacterium ANBcel5]